MLAPCQGCSGVAAYCHSTLAPRHFLGLATIAIGLALIDGRLVRPIEQRLAR